MSDDKDSKTEEPSEKKLSEARKKGQVALSREVNNWIMLLAGTMLVAGFGPSIMTRIKADLVTYIAQAHALPGLPGGVSVILGEAVGDVAGILMFPVLFLVAAALAGPFMQVGPLMAPEAIAPKWSKLNPIEGMKRLFSKRSLVEFGKGIIKISAVALVGFLLMVPFYETMDHTIGLPLSALLSELRDLFIRLMMGVLTVLVVIMVGDLLFTRIEYRERQKMTKQEVKDEYKQSEGDPHVKGKLRQLRAQKAQQRMMAAVPEADVVITNPTHYSVALKYDPDVNEAPICVAKGQDEVALRIRELAKEHDIVIYEAPPLARALFATVDIDELVPPDQYKAVAEVISYVFRLKGKLN